MSVQRAATIQIAEPKRPVDDDDSIQPKGTASGSVGGVYNLRSHSRSSVDAPSLRGRVASFRGQPARPRDSDDGVDEDGGLRQVTDFKKRQVFHGKKLLWLAFQSIGVIYGDIGTSPLYVYSSTFSSEPSYDDLVGVLSFIIWSLAFMVTLKYVIIVLRADNEGEGGTFSTYSLISRFANITNRDPREASLIKMERYQTNDLGRPSQRIRSTLENNAFIRVLLKVTGVLAVSMVMADGVLTPAQSVLGSVQGIEVVSPGISKSTVVGTTCGILVLLFLIQPFGTTKLASSFAPIVITWLGFNAAFGIYNLIYFDHTVLKAFGPNFAIEFLIRNKTKGWKQLGGILLAFTGVEALFADLGAFSRRAIQLSWLCYAFPCLLLAYIGQAAYISRHPGAYTNPFYNAAPPGTIYPALVIAILATIVASQAIITATFQLLSQIMKLSYFPQIKVVHTSKIFYGQLYVPAVNWLLMIGTVLVAAIFNNTTTLGDAYGVCVMFVTFFDTCMVTLAALIVWRVSPYYAFFPWLTVACVDGLFLSSALTKVPQGAWFTLTLAGLLTCCFILWRFGKEQQWAAEAADRFPTTHLVTTDKTGTSRLTEEYGGQVLNTVKGLGIFFDKAGEFSPIVFSQFLTKLVATPEVMVFFHLRPLETPYVPAEDRYHISKLALPNTYRCVVRHGFNDEVISPDLASLIMGLVRDFIIRQGVETEPNGHTVETSVNNEGTASESAPESEKVPAQVRLSSEDIAARLETLQAAYDHQILYIIGKEQMKIKPGTKIWRGVLLRAFLWVRENTRNKIANLRVPTDRVMEVGFLKMI